MLPSFPREKRSAEALALSIGLALGFTPVATAWGQPPPAFPEVPYVVEREPSHTWAYVAMASGLAVVGTSFLLAEKADDSYQRYLSATDPARIEALYDRGVTYDRLASGSLLAGEALVVAGLYLRFLRTPRPARLSLAIGMERCVLCWQF